MYYHGAVLLGPQTWARCGRENFTEALLFTTAFFVHYLRIFRAKTYLPLKIDGEKRVLVRKLHHWLACTWSIQ